MLKARAEGKLSGLEGESKPLPAHPEAAFVDPGEAVGYRIMAEHGALPKEIRLQRDLARVKAAHSAAIYPEAKRKAMAKIAAPDMKISIAREAGCKFMR